MKMQYVSILTLKMVTIYNSFEFKVGFLFIKEFARMNIIRRAYMESLSGNWEIWLNISMRFVRGILVHKPKHDNYSLLSFSGVN